MCVCVCVCNHRSSFRAGVLTMNINYCYLYIKIVYFQLPNTNKREIGTYIYMPYIFHVIIKKNPNTDAVCPFRSGTSDITHHGQT